MKARKIFEFISQPGGKYVSQAESLSFEQIKKICPGWSDWRQYVFFRAVASLLTEKSSLLILGVYYGMDIALMRTAGLPAEIVGVDKFSDTPCADWQEEQRDKPWADAVNAAAPSLKKATACLAACGPVAGVSLVESDDESFIAQCGQKFDVIYLDTAHDRATVERQIAQIQERGILKPDGILCGDDYDNIMPTWGVRDAVAAATSLHYVMSHRIWWCDASAIKVPSTPAPAA